MMPLRPHGPAFIKAVRDERGAAAVEFALLAPAFITLLVGIMFASMLMFSNTSLQSATTAAARCAALGKAGCTTASATATFAAARYTGMGSTPSFSCTGRTCGGTAACGVEVVGTSSFALETGFSRIVVPLRAVACFP